MAKLTDITAGLKVRIQTIDELAAFVYDKLPDRVQFPAVVIMPAPGMGSIRYNQSLGAHSLGTPGITWTFHVRIFVSDTISAEAYDRIASYVEPDGPTSVKWAIEDDPDLDGVCDDLNVPEGGNIGMFDIGGVSYLGVEFLVEVYT
jgi:hypothetical protein